MPQADAGQLKKRRRIEAAASRAGAAYRASRRSRRRRADARASAERREAILAAALDEFSARGFAATRLDDVAKRAGVAKGTIYLYFARQGDAVPGTGAQHAGPGGRRARDTRAVADMPVRVDRRAAVVDVFVREIFGTRRAGRHPADHHRRAALSASSPSSIIARCCRARASTAIRGVLAQRGRARRAPQRRACPLSATAGRAGAGRDRLERAVRPASRRSMSAALMRAHIDLLFGDGRAA